MNGQPPREGYDFVPLPDTPRRARRPEVRLDRRTPGTLDVSLLLTLTAEQPLHIGSGGYVMGVRGPTREFMTSGGGVVIPGSSLRGAVRTRFEAVTLSCLAGVGRLDRPISTKSRSMPSIHRVEIDPKEINRAGAPCGAGALCPTCALFGLTSQRGRLTFFDAHPAAPVTLGEMDMPLRFQPRFHHVGTGRADGQVFRMERLNGRKLARGRAAPSNQGSERVQVAPVGATFQARVVGRGLTPVEAGGLLVALGVEPVGRLKLGGGRGLGFGRMRVALELARWAGGPPPEPAALVRLFLDSPDHHRAGLEALARIHNKEC